MGQVGFRALRLVAAVLGVSSLAALTIVAVAWGNGAAADTRPASTSAYTGSLGEKITVLDSRRLAQAAIEWRGGPITTSTGETVDVRVSEALPLETVTPEGWAEFLAKLVHGKELSELTTYIAPLSEIEQLCGGEALGCYSRNSAAAVGEVLPDGTTPEEVVRHEYGHHIALYRSNTPWRAIDWGPKHWASASNVCARVSRREAYPGDEGEHYAQNPGEAWAETYRLMDERKAGITTARWQIVAPSFYPTEAALQAAEQDVIRPWTAGQRSVFRRQLKKGQVWWVKLSTPLDGSIAVTVTIPKGGLHQAELVAADRTTVIKRGSAAGPRKRRISGTVCGQRAEFVRVTQKGTAGPVTVAVSTP
jgi:hypothetical protein